MDQYTENLDAIFQSLADPTRRAVIARLGKGPASVTDLAKPFEMALPSFMKHVRQLEGSGLIRTQKHGRVRTCIIEENKFAMVDAWLKEQRTLWEARLDRLDAFAMKTMKESTK
ncbi:metalloregulator ArsR/SmtB family transcription factor [Mesorhizobium sp. CAU 1732]|uniref:ArsR/SmtB family transcription factor n=1 Tax=Mesorhizobium sp. CAU 1732 TaxID=3140358 RepID=UPI003260D211